MSPVLLALRLVLVAVLAVAGAAKLADRDGARAAVRGFGVPEALAGGVAAALTLIELAAAGLLLASVTARAGAGLSLALMLAFCAAITRSLAHGEAPECHCFGALHSEPAGPRTLARNFGLAAAAAVVLLDGAGTSATHWIGGLSVDGVGVLLLILALAGSVAGGVGFGLRMLRRNGELLLRVDELEDALEATGLAVPVAEESLPTAGLPVGTPAPDFRLPDLRGQPVSLASLRQSGEDLLLLFTDPDCGPCSALMPQVAAWQSERPQGRRVVLISRGGAEANLAKAADHGLREVLLQTDREVSESFAVNGTPSAVVVSATGTVATPVHAGEDEIRVLAGERAAAVLPIHHPGPAEPAIGRPAPDPVLRTLEGKLVRLGQRLPDGPALLVFWNPECGFCERMLDSLRALDVEDERLVVISTGEPQANRELGLRAPVLLDDGFATGSAFEAMGTPSAVLLDAERRVASAVAVGADEVVALAGRVAAAVPA